MIHDIWKRVTRLQTNYDLPTYSAATFEVRGGLHAHIVFIGNNDIQKCLKRSQVFGQTIEVAPVTDPDGLARRYLAKERTPQAGYRRDHLLGGRLGGSHRLEGGGDRVRLSRDLERDAIEAGFVEAWQHTYAKRSGGALHVRQGRPRHAGEGRPPAVEHAVDVLRPPPPPAPEDRLRHRACD